MKKFFQLTGMVAIILLLSIRIFPLISLSEQSYSQQPIPPADDIAPEEQDTPETAPEPITDTGYISPPVNGYNEEIAQGIYNFTLHTNLGDLIYYNQNDSRWAASPYGSDPINTHGCGPTILAMLIGSFVDPTYTPATMANWCYEHHYYVKNEGSYHSIISGGLRKFGFTVSSFTDRTPEGIRAELEKGRFLVALMGKGHFTSKGHFLLITGVSPTGNLLIADPNSFIQTQQEWDVSIILDELRTTASSGGPLWSVIPPGYPKNP